MDPAKARVHALKAAIEMRSSVETPQQIVARATVFEQYIGAKDYPHSATPSADQGQPEKAVAGARRK